MIIVFIALFCFVLSLVRVSGVTDHYANNDEHALSIARSIVANFNWKQTSNINIPEVST